MSQHDNQPPPRGHDDTEHQLRHPLPSSEMLDASRPPYAGHGAPRTDHRYLRADTHGYAGYDEPRHHRGHQQPDTVPPRPSRPPRRRPPLDGRMIGIAVASLLLGVVLGGAGVFLLVPDRAADGSTAPAALVDAATEALPGDPPAEPKTEAAVRAAATEEFDRYAAGDYGGAWDLWHSKGKQAFSRDDYVRLHELCQSPSEGLKFTIDAVDYQPGDDQAKVRASRLLGTFNYTMLYEHGRWVFMPPDDNLVDYRQGPDALAAERQAQGWCDQ